MRINGLMPQKEVLKEIGRRLQNERKRRGYTLETLAEKAGVGIATLVRMEKRGQGQMSNWVKIQLALNLASNLDNFLPENIRSPLEDAKKERKIRHPLKIDNVKHEHKVSPIDIIESAKPKNFKDPNNDYLKSEK